MLVSLIGHAWIASTFLAIDPQRDRTHRNSVAGVVVPGSGFSTDRATLVFIEEDGSASQIDRPAPPRIEPDGILALTMRPLSPVIPELSELEDDAEGTVLSAEPTLIAGTDRAALIERYIGQIRARVERAWDQAPGELQPFCRVQVKQDPRGEVLELAATECALQALDRDGLLTAIRRASPLPAPPDTSLFVPEFFLEFGETDARL
ncbi:MAG: cell envelope integrity protein TolA [Gammaproteobacteria bacterium]